MRPATPTEHCQNLLLAVVARGLMDDDASLVVGQDSDWFCAMLRALGVSDEVTFRIRVRYCLGLINPTRLRSICMDASRYGTPAPEDPVFWDAWARLPR